MPNVAMSVPASWHVAVVAWMGSAVGDIMILSCPPGGRGGKG
jgi:hypothetical protein